ncbi:MAG: AAA family ATPase [Terrimicrobiaceae bacterium]
MTNEIPNRQRPIPVNTDLIPEAEAAKKQASGIPSRVPPTPPPVRGGAPIKAMPAQSVAPVLKGIVKFGTLTKCNVGHRILLYGPGGIGKTTLACALPGPVAFVDLDESLQRLLPQLATSRLSENVIPVEGIATWSALRLALQSDGWDGVRSIVIDTGTKAEELALAWMFSNIKEKGVSVSRMEDYGYKSGYRHLFDTFNLLLSDLDAHARAGRNVVLVCHECAAKVPNPQGLDWIRYEPRLAQDDKNCQLRYRAKEWADHVLALVYDVNVSDKGKGQGSGTRTIYTSELPYCMAKSRSVQGAFPLTAGLEFIKESSEEFWAGIIN